MTVKQEIEHVLSILDEKMEQKNATITIYNLEVADFLVSEYDCALKMLEHNNSGTLFRVIWWIQNKRGAIYKIPYLAAQMAPLC